MATTTSMLREMPGWWPRRRPTTEPCTTATPIPGISATVTAHNSHVGDAGATEMLLVRDEINIGHLARQRFGSDALLVGFGTDRGTVAAASDWGGAMEIKTVRRAHAESYEALFRASAVPRLHLDLRAALDADLGHTLLKPRLERAIGVIYRPDYFEASLPQQFDRYLWFEVTQAVTPLPAAAPAGAPDTYPFGL
jgi:erythromycin esterase-like protein